MPFPKNLRTSERVRRIRNRFSTANHSVEFEDHPVCEKVDDLVAQLQGDLGVDEESEFLQAFETLAKNLKQALVRQPNLLSALYELRQPEYLVEFNVTYINEHGEQVTHRAWRCDYSSVLGPCRGGIRLHPTCNMAVIKFLGLEQTIKNSLLNMPMGGGKSGSDFDARNASDQDVASFAVAFVQGSMKIWRRGTPFDVVADLGCGPRECRFIRDAYQNLTKQTVARWKPWATGMGAVEFAKRAFRLPSFDKKVCIISGAGDAALNVARNLVAEGGRVITLSDSAGYIYAAEGLSFAQWQRIADLRRLHIPLRDIVTEDGWLRDVAWRRGAVWDCCVKADYAFPCACENEVDELEAQQLLKGSRIKGVVEVSCMGLTPRAEQILHAGKVHMAPGRATNVGAMVILGLNLAESTPEHEFEHRLRVYVGFVHDQCRLVYEDFAPCLTFHAAVDICGFMRIARAMYEMGMTTAVEDRE